MIEFFVWCIRFDYERARKDTIPTVVEFLDPPVEVDAGRPLNVSSRLTVAKACIQNVGEGILHRGQYFRVAITLWAIGNVALYVTIKGNGIYLNAPFYTFLSSFLSLVFTSAGIFVLALVKGELCSLWNYEAKALIESPTERSSTKKQEKWNVEKLFGVNMSNSEESKEAKKILVDV